VWPHLHDYQQERVLVFLDPSRDPLGRGYHIIQGTIALGSGGVLGKGWMNGTQTHLDFLPERHTDFIFAVYGEEFGLLGGIILLALYLLLIARGFMITASGVDAVHAAPRRRDHADVLHLRVRQTWDGQRHPPGGRRSRCRSMSYGGRRS
jgi:hypothetical protein